MSEADLKPSNEANGTCYDEVRDDVEDILDITREFSKLRDRNSKHYRDLKNYIRDMEKDHFNGTVLQGRWEQFYEEERRCGKEKIDETEKEFLEIKLREIIDKYKR